MSRLKPVRRLLECIRRGSFPTKDPRGNLMFIPPEIILMIAQYLFDASLLSLSLTCQAYHILLSRATRNVKLQGLDLERFLLQLEKDSTNVYFCYSCVKLHGWNSWWTNRGHHDRWLRMGRCVSDYAYWPGSDLQLTIRYPHAQLVMNRHLYGPSHGLPLTTLEYNSRTHWLYGGGKSHWSTQARIINDELFIRKTLTFWHRKDLGMRKLLYDFRYYFFICRHINGTQGWASWEYTIPELAKPLKGLKPCENSFGSCPACLTDYSISLRQRKGKQGGWHIEVVAYQNLGSCRSPYDWKWRSIAERSVWNEPRCEREPPGLVMHCWKRADGLVWSPRGEYIGKAQRMPGSLRGSRRCPWGTTCSRNDECREHWLAIENQACYW